MRGYFPWLALALMLAACGAFTGCGVRPEHALAAETEQTRQVPVVTVPVATREFAERLVIQGNVQAKNFLYVPAQVGGTLEAIFVDEGDSVVKDETKLFQVDSMKIGKAVEIRKQDLALVQTGRREKEAMLDRVKADFEKAEIDYKRFERLLAQKAVTQDAFENQTSRYKQTQAALRQAETLLDIANEQEAQAQAALAIAERDLKDSVIYAPLTGRITIRMNEVGDMAEAGKPVVAIEDLTKVEISGFVPAQYFNRIHMGETAMHISCYGVDAGDQVITYKSPTINAKLRTFEIKTVIENPPDGVVPGAMAEMTVSLDKRQSSGIPAKAIQRRNDKNVIFTIEGDKACMIEVKTGLETDGWIELLENALPDGAPVVTMGQFLLNDGTNVTIQKENS